jgi:hypothetical protein
MYQSSPFTKCGNSGGVGGSGSGSGSGSSSSSSSSNSSINCSMVAGANNIRELAQFSCTTIASTRSTSRM